MHWLIYSADTNGRLNGLRIVESPTKPHAPTLNGGFKSAQEALVLMSEYLVVSEGGFVLIDEARTEHTVTFADRMRHAFQVQPAIVWLIVLSLAMGALNMILMILHVFGA